MDYRDELAQLIVVFDWYFWDAPSGSYYVYHLQICRRMCVLLRMLDPEEREDILRHYRVTTPRDAWLKFEEELKWVR